MAIPFRRKRQPETPPKTVTAAAVSITDVGTRAWRARVGEDAWQKEAWYQFDICGEMRFALNWIANAVSMADMYIADVDPETGTMQQPTENRTAQTIGASIFGGPAKRAQAQSQVALNWQVSGEVFILIRPGRLQDEWLTLSSTEINERGGVFNYTDPHTGAMIELTSNDMLIRVWSPHPRMQSHADSAVRACLPTLREIEKTSQNIAARLDSRLSGSGVWLVPEELDFPREDDDPEGPAGFMDLLTRAAEAHLANPGHASSQVPIIATAPAEMIDATANGRITFESELSGQIIELRQDAMKRLAIGLDMPPEIMLGMGESNHWSAWQIEEAAFKVHIAPLLDRLADALTVEYLHKALQAAGVPNPQLYAVAFNTTEIISRPNRFEEMSHLYDLRLISDDFMRSEAGIPDTAIPGEEELQRRFFTQLAEKNPSVIEIPEIAEVLGIEPHAANQGAAGGGGQVAAPETPAALPARPTQAEEDNQPDEGLVAAAELIVFDALSRAGGRLLTRPYRGQFGNTPKVELHTVIPTQTDDIGRLLEGSFQFTDNVARAFGVDTTGFHTAVRGYVEDRLTNTAKHDRETLRRSLWPM